MGRPSSQHSMWHRAITWRLRAFQLLRTTRQVWTRQGPLAVLYRVLRWFTGQRAYYRTLTPPPFDYAQFCAAMMPSPVQLENQKAVSRAWTWPRFDVLMTPGEGLAQTRQSVEAQTYGAYTLHTLAPGMSPPALNGDFVLPIAAGDRLAVHALYELAVFLRAHPNSAAVYVDQDRYESGSGRQDPWLKPAPQSENMLSANPMRHGCVFARAHWAWDGLYQRDAYSLRLVRTGANIHHLPGLLLHRHTESIPGADQAALTAHLQALTGWRDVAVTVGAAGVVDIVGRTEPPPLVSIIIPSRNQAVLLQACIRSIIGQTDYPAYEIIIVDNASDQPETLALYAAWRERDALRIVPYPAPFNFSEACNQGAAAARGDVLLFLNNDTEVLHADWLSRLVRWLQLPGIGIVGPKLLYPDGTIQHAGIVFGLVDIAEHLFVSATQGEPSPFGDDGWYRNVSAVTGACLMIARPVFEAVGGFDTGYVLLYSDIELCLRVQEQGWRILYEPSVHVRHHESKTHRHRIPLGDLARARQRFAALLRNGDPHYHPYLSRKWSIPTLDTPEEIARRASVSTVTTQHTD